MSLDMKGRRSRVQYRWSSIKIGDKKMLNPVLIKGFRWVGQVKV